MAGKQKKAKKHDSGSSTALSTPGEDDATVVERTVLHPTVQAAITLKEYHNLSSDLDLIGLISALTEQTNASIDGDLKRAEAMLTAQAHTLDTIFNNLARRAIRAEHMNNLDTYLKLALRAQSQCRATWEALSAIKNPPVMGYVRQANIAHGPQQVNNGVHEDEPRARENRNQQNELMEQKDGERLDTKTPSTAGQADPAMATLGEIDGAEDASR